MRTHTTTSYSALTGPSTWSAANAVLEDVGVGQDSVARITVTPIYSYGIAVNSRDMRTV